MLKFEYIENLRAFIIIVSLFICLLAVNWAQSEYLNSVIKTENWKLIKAIEKSNCIDLKIPTT